MSINNITSLSTANPSTFSTIFGNETNTLQYNSSQGQNYSYASITRNAITQKATVQISLNGINNITYPNKNVTISCSSTTFMQTNPANTCSLFRNNTNITTASANGNNTIMDMAVGLYNLTGTGSTTNLNYTDNTTGITSFWNIARNTTRVALAITPSSPVIYPTSTTATGNESNKGDSDVTYRLYREIGNDTGAMSETITLGAGTHLYRFNASSGANWSVNATGEILTLTVNQGSPQVKLFLNGTQGNRTYTQGDFVNLTATTSATPSDPSATIFANYTGSFSQIASGTTTATNITNSNNLAVGNYSVIANVSSNANWTANATGVNYIFRVQPAPDTQGGFLNASVTYYIFPTTVWWNDSVTVNGSARYANQTGVYDAILNIIVGNARCNNTTDSAGNYTCTFAAPLELGDYLVIINVTNSTGHNITNTTKLSVELNYGNKPIGTIDRVVSEVPIFIQEMSGRIRSVIARITTWRS